MPGQTIGTVNVTIGQPKNVNVEIGQETIPKATAITYGSRTLKSLTDVSMAGAEDGDVVTYKSATNSFVIEPVDNSNIKVDNGFF